MKKGFLIYTLFVSFLAMALSACGDKDTDNTNTTIVYGSSTSSAMVSKFSLKADKKVLANLDSVRFTIDQERALIYNADSLPLGTDVTKILTSIKFGATVGKTQFVISNGKRIKEETTIDYSDTSNDSIDFTGNVTLNVSSHDGSKQMSYRVKVNVHQVQPDSLYFAMSDRRNLPASADDNKALGMAQLDGRFYALTTNNLGTYVSTAQEPTGKWESLKVTFPFEPVEKSLTATTQALYLLDTDGNLYSSDDAAQWNATGIVWEKILGAYDNCLLGLTKVDGKYYCDEYPRREGFTPSAMPEGFPVTGSSALIVTENDWSLNPVALMVGGRDEQGVLSGDTWGYDGKTWAVVSSSVKNALPPIEDATLVSYYTYEVSPYNQSAVKKATWLVMGGRTGGGVFNRTTYVSRNLGITWQKGATGVQMPDFMPSFSGALAFVCTETASLKAPAMRVSKPVTEWDVPYLYLVGGVDTNGYLLNNIWKGSITRMLFKPIY